MLTREVSRLMLLTEVAPGIFVHQSSFALTNATVIAGEKHQALVVDPGVTVAELAELAKAVAARGLQVSAGFATHPHWDHVLWSRELGDAPRFAAPGAVHITQTERPRMLEMLEMLERSASGHDLTRFGQLTPLPAGAAAVPWAGPTAATLTHNGHAPGHTALFLPDSGVLLAGDMLSDVEVPLLDLAEPSPLADYRRGLERLAALEGVRVIIPGHGGLGDGGEFLRRVDADRRYLDDLERGREIRDERLAGAPDWLRQSHAAQVQHAQRRD